MKRDLINARQNLAAAIEDVESILTIFELRGIVIRDGEWIETAGAVADNFRLKADLYLRRLNKIIDHYPRKKRIKKDERNTAIS